jgi:23S rRNA pseudouridine955/2504/2580 synthase/23S rRNA pseudouridine1911/1915/1917 synthase
MAKFDPAQLVLWVDDDLVAVSKPAGLLTIQHGYDPDQPYLLDLLQENYRTLWVVHRLDRDTSGVIVFARNPQSHRVLNTQFERRQVTKTYHALVVGAPNWREARIELPLRVDGDRAHRTVIDTRNGKPAITDVRVLEHYRGYALVEASPRSGRRHQIRAHLAAEGCPIAADTLYGDGEAVMLSALNPGYRPGRQGESPLLGRLGLHAQQLAFAHPRDGRSLRIQAPYPKDLQRTLKQLRKYQQ